MFCRGKGRLCGEVGALCLPWQLPLIVQLRLKVKSDNVRAQFIAPSLCVVWRTLGAMNCASFLITTQEVFHASEKRSRGS